MPTVISFDKYFENRPSPALAGLVPSKIRADMGRLSPFDQDLINNESSAIYYFETSIISTSVWDSYPHYDLIGIPQFYICSMTARQLVEALGNTSGNMGYLLRVTSSDGYGWYMEAEVANIDPDYVTIKFRGGRLDESDPDHPVKTQIGSQNSLTFFDEGNMIYIGGGWAAFGRQSYGDLKDMHLLTLTVCSCVDRSGTYPVIDPTWGETAQGVWKRWNSTHSYWEPQLPFGVQVSDILGYVYFNSFTVDIYEQNLIGTYGSIDLIETSSEAGPPSEEQGMDDPSFDDSSDTIDEALPPTLGITNVGFVRVYNTGVQSLQDLGVELFPPLQYTNPTPLSGDPSVAEAIIGGFNALITFMANIPSFFDQIMANTLISYVIDCHVIPVTPHTAASSENIQVGYKTLQVSAPRVTSDYVDFDCGSINIAEYYANFADYLTTAKLYLPFIGFVPVRAEWFQAATLSVHYRFNVIDGSFVVWVKSTGRHTNNSNASGTILGQYAGNACVHLPITGPTYASMVSGLVGAGAGMAAGAATGNPAAIATSAIAAASQHGDIAQSNAYNGSAAFLSCRTPFLMIERPVSSYAMNYQHEIGIPANIYSTVGSVSGFVKADNVHLDAIPCTDAERQMIQTALREGVIV